MKIKQLAAFGIIATLCGQALAQTPLPITNGSFEDDDAIFGGVLGYNVLSPADVRAVGDGISPTAVARTGTRSMGFPAPGLNQFLGLTTDTINIYIPSRPFFDPAFNWYGGNIRLTVWYNIPAGQDVTGGFGNLKLNVKQFNQDYATKEEFLIQGTTNGAWQKAELVWNKKDIKETVWFLATEGCDTGCFVNNGTPPYGLPPYPARMKITLGRWGGENGGGPGTGYIFIDDVDVSQDPSCPADFNGDAFVDDTDFVDFAGSYNNLIDFRCDLDGDGLTDDADFVIFASAYNELLCTP